jgi:outer membrane protein OmpA-like peptidoglycan-associated protein
MNKLLNITLSFFFLAFSITLFSQKTMLDGYVYEKNNRGFLNEVKVTILDQSGVFLGEILSDIDGHYTYEVPINQDFVLEFSKKIFKINRQNVSTKGKSDGEKVFVKTELERQPGYLLEVTLAEKRFSQDVNVDAVNGSRVEIYNHTTKREELVVDSAKSPVFSITLQQGNEYTILVRKKGFYNKRLHANVNINGCYLCMDGFGTVNPGVVSNLTAAENNKLGTLIANVEMERIDTNRNIVVQNIYYTSNSAELFENAQKELDKIIQLLKINPTLIVELGSHTDSRGGEEANKILSQKRAQAAVDYILRSPWIEPNRLRAKGYGENRLTNRCEDGITCSDEEHQQNRRTELRIIGFTNDAYQEKSLLEIIHQEDMMSFVTSGESDKIYTGTSVPEEQTNTNNPEVKQPVAPNHIDNFPAETPPSVMTAVETPSTVSTPVITEKQVPEMPLPVSVAPKEASRPEDIHIAIAVNLKPIGEYSGYKIELFTAPNQMALEDPDLRMIANEVASDIYLDKLANGSYSYSVGSFQNWGETERFLNKIIQKYPKSKIVDYFKGKRVGE